MDEAADQLIVAGYRPGTKANLKSQISAYYEFCDRYQLAEIPANTGQLTRFAVYLFRIKKLSPDSIMNYLSAVRTLHGLLEIPTQEMHGFVLDAVMRGMKAEYVVPRRRALAFDPLIFRQMFVHVDFDNPMEMVAWVAALMGFHLLLRVSNITAKSRFKFNKQENLVRADFRIHNKVMLVHIRWSKTLQYGERKLLIPVIPFLDAELSATAWFQFMIHKIPAPPDAPAFAVPGKNNQLFPLSYGQFSRLLRKWTTAANLNSARLTSHGLRRGGTTWLTRNGVPDHIIQAIGDWRTQVFRSYIDQSLKERVRTMVAFS